MNLMDIWSPCAKQGGHEAKVQQEVRRVHAKGATVVERLIECCWQVLPRDSCFDCWKRGQHLQ